MAIERGSALRGQTVRLRIRFRQSGVLADPFTINSLSIQNDALTTIDTIPVASIAHDGIGLYHADWGIPSAEAMELHHDLWAITPTSGASLKTIPLDFYVHDFIGGTVGTPYMTTGEFKEYLPTATILTDAEINALGAVSQEIVETCCGQRFQPVTMARVFDGRGRAVQPLDHEIVPESITKIEVRYSGSWTDVTPSDLSDVRYMRSRHMISLGNVYARSQGYNDDELPVWYRSEGACGIFPTGVQNVRITADWGRWQTVPAQIKAALGTLVRYAARCDDAQGLPSNPYSAESVESGRSYTLRQIQKTATVDRMTGYPDVDAIVARFTRPLRSVTVI